MGNSYPSKTIDWLIELFFFLQLYYGVEPDFLEYVPDKIHAENGYQPELMVDSFRHVFLGKHPLLIKQCSRYVVVVVVVVFVHDIYLKMFTLQTNKQTFVADAGAKLKSQVRVGERQQSSLGIIDGLALADVRVIGEYEISTGVTPRDQNDEW